MCGCCRVGVTIGSPEQREAQASRANWVCRQLRPGRPRDSSCPCCCSTGLSPGSAGLSCDRSWGVCSGLVSGETEMGSSGTNLRVAKLSLFRIIFSKFGRRVAMPTLLGDEGAAVERFAGDAAAKRHVPTSPSQRREEAKKSKDCHRFSSNKRARPPSR